MQERRQQLLKLLQSSDTPVSGTQLADLLAVSRQTIVQDIAFLRKDGFEIVSTTLGYVLPQDVKNSHRDVLGIVHTPEQLKRELEILVAHHVRVEDVFIDHPVYGRIHGELNIATPKDVKTFLEKRASSMVPLFSEVTGGLHYHTIVAEDAETIAEAKKALEEEGFQLADLP
ncbi:transcription repressor NadR [Fodinisporobacter ferrooxydans]|uniref:Transcription repressor NadR n=1 Tax=Fodinisporobacter ferrooxydans TaxID=2901836 RepID=A0ABY4CG43_9BACL|nr:transcription repressor NadR [Alicyclobacillaceae bacterium MYW30-H2]